MWSVGSCGTATCGHLGSVELSHVVSSMVLWSSHMWSVGFYGTATCGEFGSVELPHVVSLFLWNFNIW